MKIYIFGNPLIKEDSVSLLTLHFLRKKFPLVNFITVDPNENFPPQGESDLIILDVVKGVQKVMLLDYSDLASVEKSPVSPHDYDLLLHLLLLKKMGKINEVKIIGIPYGVSVEGISKEASDIISTLLSKSGKHKTYTDQKP